MSTDDNLHKEIGNYRVVREIDSGAFGRVYLAQHTLLKNRTVAIKLLHTTHLSSMEERESFLREAQFLEVLKHPYILPILDVGIHEGFPYLVAEYAPNGSLRDRIRRYAPRPLPVQETLTILTQVGQALYYAHQQHIIHRDIKPENILFNARGEALLADFGVAITMETASIKFATVIGTPSYMAPEQFQNSVSKESDQYALGCIAYELFTGQRPFTANDFFAMGFKHLREDAVPPSRLNPQMPPYVEQAILRAIAKQRADRFPDIKTFITELHLPTNSQGRLPAMPSAPIPAVSLPQIPAVDPAIHLSQSPTLSNTNPPAIFQNPPAAQLPQTASVDQKLISTGPREHTSDPFNQDPVTPLPPTRLEIPAKFDSDPAKLSMPLYPTLLTPADSRPLPTPQYQGPVTPFPISPPQATTAPRNFTQSQKNNPRRKWLTILATVMAILILVLSGVVGSLLIFFRPTLSFTGSSNVAPGGTLHLHGSGFFPGLGISLTLDDSTSLSYIGRDTAGEAWYADVSNSGALQTLSYRQVMAQNSLNSSIVTSSGGAFDTIILVRDTWPVGVHSIRAVEGIWTAQINFTIVPKVAHLTINTNVLDFGKVGMGVQPTLSIAVGNSGGDRLVWTAGVDNASWLKLQKNTGVIEPGALQQTINVTADTRSLKEGTYSGILHISSNGGDVQVQVKLQVGPHHNGPVLDVNPRNLNFGSLMTSQERMQIVTIGNVGNQTLNWIADTGGSSWLTLTSSIGTVKADALPETIYATVDTTNLTPGNYGATINVLSNGGTIRLAVSLVITGPTPPPGVTPTSGTTATPDPTKPPPTATPDPTPPGPETLTVPFTSNGVFTSRSYSGIITVTVSGVGQANGTRYSDAFYIYANGFGTPITPNHTLCWVMFINQKATDNFTKIPGYASSHSYVFTMTAPGGPLNFSVCDGQRQDDSGQYIITITQN